MEDLLTKTMQQPERVEDSPSSESDSSFLDMTSLKESVEAGRTEQTAHQSHLAGLQDMAQELDAKNSPFRHLRSLAQQVNIHFWSSTPTFVPQSGDYKLQNERTITVETTLNDGLFFRDGESSTIVHGLLCPGQDLLVIPIKDASAHPVSDQGCFGQVSVSVGMTGAGLGVGIASFPSDQSLGKAYVARDGIIVALRISDQVSIVGELEAPVTDEALQKHMSESLFTDVLKTPRRVLLDSSREKGITFTPSSISFALTPRLERILELEISFLSLVILSCLLSIWIS